MNYIVFFSPVLFLSAVLVTLYINRTRFYYLFIDAHHSQLFSPVVQNKTRAKDYLSTPIEDTRLIPLAEVKNGIKALTSYIDETRPDWVGGINLAGRLLSTYIVNQLGWSSDKCLFIRPSYDKRTWEIEKDFLNAPESKIRNQVVSGKLLIVDDTTRTGATLASVRSFIVNISLSNDYDLDRVMFATLLEETLRVRPRS